MLIIDQTRVHLDKVEGLGSFVELEVVLRDEQSTEDGEVFICFRNDPVVMPLLSLPCSLSPRFKFLLISSCGCVNACVSVCVYVCVYLAYVCGVVWMWIFAGANVQVAV